MYYYYCHDHFDIFHPYVFSAYNIHAGGPVVYALSRRQELCGVGRVRVHFGHLAWTKERRMSLSGDGRTGVSAVLWMRPSCHRISSLTCEVEMVHFLTGMK